MGNRFCVEANNSHSKNNDRNKLFTFESLELYGPLNGYYYHHHDKQNAIENNEKNANHEIKVIFKYEATDFENIKKNVNINDDNDDNDDDDEKKENEINNNDYLKSIGEFQKFRFEWIYYIGNDPSYRRINDSSCDLPPKYEAIREALYKNDPIPPHFLRQTKMAGKVMESVLDSRLRKKKELKCRIIIKALPDLKVTVYHPAVLLWDKNEQFGEYNDDRGYIIHLIKLLKEFQTKENKEKNKDEMEIECRAILKKELEENNWDYTKYKIQDIKLENGLTDIAHWCLKYEMKKEYKYELYSTDCIQFMTDLCNEFNICYTVKGWSNLPYEVGKVSNKICGSF